MKNLIAAAFLNLATTKASITEACHKFGKRVGKANNTEVTVTADKITVKLYATNVVTLTKDGILTINMGGYGTAVTRLRINGTLQALGLRQYQVSQMDHEQMIQGKAFDEDKPQVFNLLAVEVEA